MTALTLGGWLVAFAALTLELVRARRSARQTELVNRACHELRGPLTAARLGLHRLERQLDAPEGVAPIELELSRAGLALDDLAAARVGQTVADSADVVALDAVVAESVAAWGPLAKRLGRGLRLAATAPARVRGDRVRIAQACGNLLANALEHGEGDVEVAVSLGPQHARLEVADAGPGLPISLSRLVQGARRGRDGRGRGLAIAAAVATRHGGSLRAVPTTRGARLALELPLAETPTAGPPPAPVPGLKRFAGLARPADRSRVGAVQRIEATR